MKHQASIGDETFSFRDYPFDDRKVTGSQIAEAVGAHPLHDFVVLRQLKSLELEALRPTELADLDKSIRFFVMRGSDYYGFEVDGLSMVWPLKWLTGRAIKQLVDKDKPDIELLLAREDDPDRIVEDHDRVDLSADGLEILKTREVTIIIVEGAPHRWLKPTITFDEVVTLEVPDYPQHQEITYSVRYSRGPGDRPEGVLVKGASITVKNRMVFGVSETGQS